MKGHNYGGIPCKKCGKLHINPNKGKHIWANKKHPLKGKSLWKDKKHPRGMLGKENKWGHHTEEWKRLISKIKKKRYKEGRIKLSGWAKLSKEGYFKGKNNPMYGKKHTKESRDKMSLNGRGKNPKLSETRKKLFKEGKLVLPSSVFKKGHVPSNKGKKCPWLSERNKDPEFIKKALKSLLKRPTSYEKKISELCIEHNLPFIYCGNGTFLIGHKNPDFVNKEKKIAIEVYHNYFKIRDFGSCEEYEKQRREYFAKYGYRTIFIRTEDINHKNWENVCLNKITGEGKDEING
jgi:hypothetical protein